MGTSKQKVIVVMPAYNAAMTVEKTVRDIPEGTVDEVILNDDNSTDNTVQVAKDLGITVLQHEENKGYGANQKSLYDCALGKGADIVVMVHPDYQYDPRVIPAAVNFLENDICDVIMGSRIRTRRETLECGMPIYKYISNRFLTTVENFVLGQNMGDFHSGFRVYTRKVLETIETIIKIRMILYLIRSFLLKVFITDFVWETFQYQHAILMRPRQSISDDHLNMGCSRWV